MQTPAPHSRTVTLRDGDLIKIRHLESSDYDALLDFFMHIPDEERYFLRDDVTSPQLVRDWTENIDHSRAIPIIATADGRIIAEGAVVRRKGAARSHVAEIRLAVVPIWRNRGVGTEMIRSLCEVASHAGFDAVLYELVEYGQADAIKAAEEMGFVHVGRLEGGASDREGNLHDMVTLAMPLSEYWAQR
jgi:L-amino acid N-acyltransferase YncA